MVLRSQKPNSFVSNYEIMSNENVSMSNENVSMSNHCESSESSVCDASGQFQLSAKKPETTVHTRPVLERKMLIRFNDYELS